MLSLPGPEPSTEAQAEDPHPTNNKILSFSVSYVYNAKLVQLLRNVTVTWIKNLMNYSLTINVQNLSDESQCYSCKIDIKTWQFWGKKGLKSLEVDGKRLDVYWDFRQAKFTSCPEPSSDYYVAIVQDEEVVLMLGDSKSDAYKRTRKRPSLEEPTLLCKKENVYGKKLFCTKSILKQDGKHEQDIVVELANTSGMGDPEMWISVDGFEVIHVMNLNWRFRGNENVTLVDHTSLQIFWDVHDWLFGSSGTRHGLFVLKPGSKGCNLEDGNVNGSHGINDDSDTCNSEPEESQQVYEFVHVIDAWKIE